MTLALCKKASRRQMYHLQLFWSLRAGHQWNSRGALFSEYPLHKTASCFCLLIDSLMCLWGNGRLPWWRYWYLNMPPLKKKSHLAIKCPIRWLMERRHLRSELRRDSALSPDSSLRVAAQPLDYVLIKVRLEKTTLAKFITQEVWCINLTWRKSL